MKKRSLIAAFALAAMAAVSGWAQAPEAIPPQAGKQAVSGPVTPAQNPVTPSPAPSPPGSPQNFAARKTALLNYFATVVSNKQLIIGQHVNWSSNDTDEVEAIFSQTDKYPAMLGVWANMHGSWGNMAAQSVADAQGWAAAGGIVFASMWAANPTNEKPADSITVNFHSILTDGTPEKENWHRTLDDVAAKLQTLRNDGTVVLFRPFVELNGDWFWWGNQNPADFIQLWKETHDYLVNTKGLDNLLFVYNLAENHGNYAAYYPGDAYADIVSFDAYTSTPAVTMATTYDALSELKKPLMIAEFGCNSAADAPFHSCNYDALIGEIHRSEPNVFAVAVWSQVWALAVQQGATPLLNEPWVITRGLLPPEIR